jgi:hypothetical protein
MVDSSDALGPLIREFHSETRAGEVLHNLDVMLGEWNADYPEGKPFTVRISNGDYPRITFELIPVEAP